MDNMAIIPKDKFDVEAVTRLALAQCGQILGNEKLLLEWIADMNWPVAKELIKVMPIFHKELLPYIAVILKNQEEDMCLKISIVEHLLPRFPNDSLEELASHITLIANINPKDEDELELRDAAINLLTYIRKVLNISEKEFVGKEYFKD